MFINGYLLISSILYVKGNHVFLYFWQVSYELVVESWFRKEVLYFMKLVLEWYYYIIIFPRIMILI